jgi:glycosyltransferase involved in cell wall biosynthesis
VSPLRVVHASFVSDPQQRDGQTLLREWPTIKDVATAVADAGVELTVVQASHRRETFYCNGVTFQFVDGRANVLHAIAAAAPAVVHVNGFHRPIAIRELARRLPRVPILVQDHGTHALRWPRRLVWRWASERIAGVSFTAREQAEAFIAAGSLRRTIHVFDILESSTRFTAGNREEARRRTGITGTPALLWTGHLDANKDPLTVLDAFAAAAPGLADARLWCWFGQAPLLDAVRRRIGSDPVLDRRVTLLGFKPHGELEHCFRAADFFVQLSHREGSGYSLIEALACGATPLVSDIPSFRRIVGEAGSLTPVGDAAALARAIMDWGSRDSAALRDSARRRFDEALTFERLGRDLRIAYETLLRAS